MLLQFKEVHTRDYEQEATILGKHIKSVGKKIVGRWERANKYMVRSNWIPLHLWSLISFCTNVSFGLAIVRVAASKQLLNRAFLHSFFVNNNKSYISGILVQT